MKNEPPFEDRMMRAYESGREARRLRHGQQTCPHAEGTPAHAHWIEGWQASPVKTLPAKGRRMAALVVPVGVGL